MAVKLAVVGLVGMAAAGLLSLMVTWWASPFDTVNANRLQPTMFDQRGVVAIGYVAFAFALGVTAGVLTRRTLPAMAATLVGFTVFRLAVIHWLRPRFISPLHRVIALDRLPIGFGGTNSGAMSLHPEAPDIANAWIYSTRVVDNAGHALTPQVVASACPQIANVLRPPVPSPGNAVRVEVPAGVKDAIQECVAKIGTKFHVVVTYQPGKNYWALQWFELAFFLGATLALCGFCFWWVRRRLA
jgi:hypothetical protein